MIFVLYMVFYINSFPIQSFFNLLLYCQLFLQMQSSAYQPVSSNNLNAFLQKVELRINSLETENTELKTKIKRMERALGDTLPIINAMKKAVIPDYGKKIEHRQSAHTNHFDLDSYNLDSSISSSSSLKRQYEEDEYYEDRYGNKNIDRNIDRNIDKYKDLYYNEFDIHKRKKVCSRTVSDPRLDVPPQEIIYYNSSDNSTDNSNDNSRKLVREYPMRASAPASKIDLHNSEYYEPPVPEKIIHPKKMLCYKNICNDDCNYAHSIDELSYCNRHNCNGFCNSLIHCQQDYDILTDKVERGDKIPQKCEHYGSNPKACDTSKCRKIHHNRLIKFNPDKC